MTSQGRDDNYIFLEFAKILFTRLDLLNLDLVPRNFMINTNYAYQ